MFVKNIRKLRSIFRKNPYYAKIFQNTQSIRAHFRKKSGFWLRYIGDHDKIVFYAFEREMRFRRLHAVQAFQLAVNAFQAVGGIGDDLEQEIVFAGEVITGDDVGVIPDRGGEGIVKAGVLEADFHKGGDVLPDFFHIEVDGVAGDDARRFQFMYAFYDRRHRKADLIADGGSLLAGVLFQTFEDFIIKLIHNGSL